MYPGQSWMNPQALWIKGQPITLGPMRVGQILDGAFRLYRMRFGTLFVLASLVLVPFETLLVIITMGSVEPVTILPGVTVRQPAAWVTYVSLVIRFLFVTPLLTAALVKTAADTILGSASTVGSALRGALPRIHSILWVASLVALAGMVLYVPGIASVLVGASASPPDGTLILLGLIALLAALVPALTLFVRFSFAPSVVMVDDIRGIAALRRSWQLVQGLTKKVLGTTVLAGLLVSVPMFILGLVSVFVAFGSLVDASGGPGPAFYGLREAAEGVIAILTTPFLTLVGVLLYFDARVRKERFDLTLMARQVGRPPPPHR